MRTCFHTILLTTTFLAALMLSACGGGGSSPSPAPPPPVTTYTIGVTVSGLGAGKSVVLQNNGGDNLTVSAVGSYTFGTALSNGAAYAVTVLTQPAGQFCTVVNGGSGTVSGVNVTTIVVSCVNLPASGKAWGTAASITGSEPISTTLRISSDASGNAMAVWEQVRTTNINAHDVWYSRYTVGQGWSAPAVIPRSDPIEASENSRDPDVAMDANGNAIAVWRQNFVDGIFYAPDDRFYIWSSRYTAGSGWGPRELIGQSGINNSRDPKIAFDAGGNALAVWRFGDVDVGIQYNRYTLGSGWGSPATPGNIGGLGVSSTKPIQLAMNASGDAVVAWSQGTPSLVWSSRYAASTLTWSTPEPIETDYAVSAVVPKFAPEVAIDAGGNAVAVWQRHDGQNINIYANRYSVATGWGTAEPIASGNTGMGNSATNPKIVIDASGNAMAMWQQYFYEPTTGSYSSLLFNRYTVATGWGTPAVMDSDSMTQTISSEYYRIAINTNGDTVAIWVVDEPYDPDSVDLPTSLKSSRYSVGTGWTTHELIETDVVVNNTAVLVGGNVYSPALVIDPSGNALAVWVQPTLLPWDFVPRIWFNRYE